MLISFPVWATQATVFSVQSNRKENYAINGPVVPIQEVPQAAPVATPAPSNGVNRFCTQCGKQARPEDRFCGGCGTKLF